MTKRTAKMFGLIYDSSGDDEYAPTLGPGSQVEMLEGWNWPSWSRRIRIHLWRFIPWNRSNEDWRKFSNDTQMCNATITIFRTLDTKFMDEHGYDDIETQSQWYSNPKGLLEDIEERCKPAVASYYDHYFYAKLMAEIYELRLINFSSVRVYMFKLLGLRLESLYCNNEFTDAQMRFFALNGIPDDDDWFTKKTTLQIDKGEDEKTWMNVLQPLEFWEGRLKEKMGLTYEMPLYVNGVKNTNHGRRNRKIQCWQCGRRGHKRSECSVSV